MPLTYALYLIIIKKTNINNETNKKLNYNKNFSYNKNELNNKTKAQNEKSHIIKYKSITIKIILVIVINPIIVLTCDLHFSV